ncbi:flavin-containing monooxygenase [Arenimonas oryziterrae]|uniref:Monooxygenase n=1 Tax=Arenimonas oryziterrae DSM 21050 = YC6267 TaxID=1121015 RepID=A0A091APU1_9GAMM|nr:NAD(P)/FAD-dependent oxidoreductase [Arenimonas oryziterrae]KFN42193.1 hypothetical protein N789_14495 [Arenimonas oryziterrae DSM 21050 = YC6267]
MKTCEALIIGSGFGGQCAAIHLLRQGIRDFLILERRDFPGGTWCQNRYPGAAVDVQSPLYSIAGEPYPWTQMFAEQDELEAYTRYLLDKYQLHERIRLNTRVVGARWDAGSATWDVQSEDQSVFRAPILINATGPLSSPVTPDFPGRERFLGKSFHTNHWDRHFDVRDQRVAIIGSGASAAQVIPAIAPAVRHLHVFQRTPHWVLPRPDRKFGRFARALLRIRPIYRTVRTAIYWGLESRVLGFKYSRRLLDLVARRQAERLLRRSVADPGLREKLTPAYTIGCKRILLSSTLYPALTRANVSLHSREQGIRAINETGILTDDGQQIDVDLIVYSTGYDATDGVISYPVTGTDGRRLSETWKEFPRAYLGTCVPGFPNLFIVTGPNTGIGHTSALFIIESQMIYVMKCIAWLKREKRRAIEVTPEAEADYTKMIHTEMAGTVWKTGGCHSWYLSKSGHVVAMFPGFSFSYRRLARNFRPEHHRLV